MYVISLIETDGIFKGQHTWLDTMESSGNAYVIDEEGKGHTLLPGQWKWIEVEGEHPDILRECIEALQEENAELKFRLASLGK